MEAGALVAEIDGQLRSIGNPERAVRERAYLKSDLEHYGVSVPAIRSVVRAVKAKHPEMGHDEVVALVDELWAAPVHERRMVAVELLDLYGDRPGAGDMRLLERLLRESRTWALVDGLAASVAGGVVERHPAAAVLDCWATDADFWLRRSALALLLPLRREGVGCDVARSRQAPLAGGAGGGVGIPASRAESLFLTGRSSPDAESNSAYKI
jgi:3-methyladenine DNA glycosylase AlkD